MRQQIAPPLGDVAAKRVEPPQQSRGIAQIEGQGPQRVQQGSVVQRECGVVLSEFEVEQRLVPPDVHLGDVLGCRPERLARDHPAESVLRAPGHFHHMRDGVMRPEAVRFEFGRRAQLILGAGIIARLFQTEAVEREDARVAGLILRPERQRPRRPVAHPAEPSQVAVEQRHRLMRDQVERVAHQMPVQHRGRRAARARRRLLQRGEMRLLAFIQRQTGRVLDQGPRLTEQARIVGQREQPGLAEMRHGEIGRRLARRIEQAR